MYGLDGVKKQGDRSGVLAFPLRPEKGRKPAAVALILHHVESFFIGVNSFRAGVSVVLEHLSWGNACVPRSRNFHFLRERKKRYPGLDSRQLTPLGRKNLHLRKEGRGFLYMCVSVLRRILNCLEKIKEICMKKKWK